MLCILRTWPRALSQAVISDVVSDILTVMGVRRRTQSDTTRRATLFAAWLAASATAYAVLHTTQAVDRPADDGSAAWWSSGDAVIALLLVAAGAAAVAWRRARRLAERAQELALTDALTGIPNRTLLLDRLGQALSRLGRTAAAVAVFYVDLDGFKAVNDRFGHLVGDEALVAAAQRLRACLRSSDTLARMGGDEFVVVCEGLSAPELALDVGRRQVAPLDVPIMAGGHRVRLAASVGVAVACAQPADAQALIASADGSMYRAKLLGARLGDLDTADTRRLTCLRDGANCA